MLVPREPETASGGGRGAWSGGGNRADAVAAAPLAPEHGNDPAVGAALERLMASSRLASSTQLRRFLTYVTAESLAGRGEAIKAYNIATAALGRGPEFDAAADPIVRVEATRLRSVLASYYSEEGADETIRFRIAPGSYRPLVERRVAAPVAALAAMPDADAAADRAASQAASQAASARGPLPRLTLGLLVLNLVATIGLVAILLDQSARIEALTAQVEALSQTAR